MSTWNALPGPQTLALALLQEPDISGGFFGGARGPGKTAALRAFSTLHVARPEYKATILRKNAVDLRDWIQDSRRFYAGLGGKGTGNPVNFRFPSESIIFTGHLATVDSWENYQGAETHLLGIEELPQIPNRDTFYLMLGSVRSTILGVQAKWFTNGNPNGVGVWWVKRMFIDPDPALYDVENKEYCYVDYYGTEKVCRYKIITDRITQEKDPRGIGMKFFYVPATIDDNPILVEKDPQYVQYLESLKSTNPRLYDAWRWGSWDSYVGQVFGEFSEDRHVVSSLAEAGINKESFSECLKILALDLGWNDPMSLHWLLVTPQRRVVVYREWYERHVTYKEWVDRIREKLEKEPVDYIMLPHDATARVGGAKSFRGILSDGLTGMELSPRLWDVGSLNKGAKLMRQDLLHSHLKDTVGIFPKILIHASCENLIRSLPALVHDEKDVEQIDTKMDHEITNAYDSVTYGLLGISEIVTRDKNIVVHRRPNWAMESQQTILTEEQLLRMKVMNGMIGD
jgi:hypothetical protein